jgi:hypothetical protein
MPDEELKRKRFAGCGCIRENEEVTIHSIENA